MKKPKFSEDMWPWISLGTDKDGRLLGFVAIRRNGSKCLQIGSHFMDDTQEDFCMERAIKQMIVVISKCTRCELIEEIEKAMEIKRLGSEPEYLKPFLHSIIIISKVFLKILMNPFGLLRSQLRQEVGWRVRGTEVDYALGQLIQSDCITRTKNNRYRMSEPKPKSK
jgi:hypothetical protein